MTGPPSAGRPRAPLLRALGIRPSFHERMTAVLGAAIREAEERRGTRPDVLDAGCGRKSLLRPFRGRIARLSGIDVHAPDPPLGYLDDFAAVDLCDPGASVEDQAFDVVLSNFTLEHFADPGTAIGNLRRVLRPGGSLVIATVNRRHPFVATYLGLPAVLRDRLQAFVKASADAHPLVGRCNDPRTIVATLSEAGFERVGYETVSHLARAWHRRLPGYVLGILGDLLTLRIPSRRSTIIAVARAPGPGDAPR